MFVLIILTNHQWLNDSTRTACRVTKKSSNAFSLKNKNLKLFIRSLQFSKNWAKLLLKAFLWTDEQERTKNGPEKKQTKKNNLI